MEKPVRLHLGCGVGTNEKYWPGFTNHDAEVDIKNLPYGDGEVDEIHLIHVFEHLPRTEIDEFLNEWKRVLKPGGLLAMEMPSLDKIAKLISDGATNPHLTLFGIFGDVRDEDVLMHHRWCWGEFELAQVLSGWDVTFPPPVYHIEKRDLRVEARREE